MNFVLCYQTPNDTVVYIDDSRDSYQSVSYNDFLLFASKYITEDYNIFLEKLNMFYTIYINLNTGKWEIFKKEFKKPTLDELIKLNENIEQRKLNKKLTSIERSKLYLNNIVDKKHNIQRKNVKDKNSKTYKDLKVLQ